MFTCCLERDGIQSVVFPVVNGSYCSGLVDNVPCSTICCLDICLPRNKETRLNCLYRTMNTRPLLDELLDELLVVASLQPRTYSHTTYRTLKI